MRLEQLESLDGRIPTWPRDRLAERPCPLCGTAQAPVLRRPDGLPLSYCGECGIWFVASIIRDETLKQFYSDYWRDFRPTPSDWLAARRMRAAAASVAGHDGRLLRLEALLGGLHGRRILDVGCGLGSFLLAANARGAEVVGQDISQAACDFVRGRLGLSVYGEPFERCAIGAIGSVDAVVMIDLIEHLADPRAALEKAWEMLGPRGLLLLWTPNGGAAGASLATARRWAGFRVDLDHLQYFSPGTVMALGTNRGWRIEHLETLGFPDLRRIGKTPRLAGTSLRNAVRYCASRFPGARRFAMALRAFGRELGVAALPDARLGTYHLFAILRRA